MGVSKKGRSTFQHSGRSFTWWVDNVSVIRIVSENKKFIVDYLLADTPSDAGGLLAVHGVEFLGLENESRRPIVLDVPKSIGDCYSNSIGSAVDAILTWSLDPSHEIVRYKLSKPNDLGIDPE